LLVVLVGGGVAVGWWALSGSNSAEQVGADQSNKAATPKAPATGATSRPAGTTESASTAPDSSATASLSGTRPVAQPSATLSGSTRPPVSKSQPTGSPPSQKTSGPPKTTPTSTPTVTKSVVPKPKVDCSGNNAFVRDKHGGLKVRPECMK